MSAVAGRIKAPRTKTGLGLLILALIVSVGAFAIAGLGLRGRVPQQLAVYGTLLAAGFVAVTYSVNWNRGAAPAPTPAAQAVGKWVLASPSAGVLGEQYLREITVPGISLDEFVYAQGNPPPQAVKMDIEGGEVMALPGMKRVLAEARPLMLMELHGPESARAAWDALTAAGYNLCEMKPGYPRVPSLDALDWKSYLVALP